MRFVGWKKLWLLAAAVYGVVLTVVAVEEHDYIYESKHYESVIGDMDKDSRAFYFNQKCNNLESYPDASEPHCFTLRTIDDGWLNFDSTTSETEADNVLKAYNKAAFKYVAISSGKFLAKFLLIWAVPVLTLYLLGIFFKLDKAVRPALNESGASEADSHP